MMPLDAERDDGRCEPRSDARPTILFLIHDLRSGGAERIFLNYVNNVRTVRAVALLVRPIVDLLDELSPAVPLYDLSVPIDGATSVHPARRNPGEDGSPPRATAWFEAIPGLALISLVVKAHRLATLAARTDAMIVCTFLHKSNIIALTAKQLFRRRLRVVINMHEMPGPYMDFHFPPLRRAVMRWFTRHGLPRADLIIAVAEGVKQDLVQTFGVPAERVVVVHNPIDLEHVRRSALEPLGSLPVGGAGPLIVAVGRLVPFKGFDLLIRAVARLPAPLNARLVIIGEGDERGRLEALIDACALRGSVALVGLQSNPWRYMARADAFVLSSLTEAFPNVIIEAFALAVPVVATDCSPGVRELLDDGQCGVLVRPGDEQALAGALDRVLTDAPLRERLSARGPARASAFDLEARVRHYEQVLTAVLAG
jgi:glycosyltransferase involved in cell wall biosynthesis